MQLKPPRVFPDRSAEVVAVVGGGVGGGIGQQQMARPYVPAGLGSTNVPVFAPRVCSDKTWTAPAVHAAAAEMSTVSDVGSRASTPTPTPNPDAHLWAEFCTILATVSYRSHQLYFPLDLLQRASCRGCCGSVLSEPSSPRLQRLNFGSAARSRRLSTCLGLTDTSQHLDH